jgi:hypothetical protein
MRVICGCRLIDRLAYWHSDDHRSMCFKTWDMRHGCMITMRLCHQSSHQCWVSSGTPVSLCLSASSITHTPLEMPKVAHICGCMGGGHYNVRLVESIYVLAVSNNASAQSGPSRLAESTATIGRLAVSAYQLWRGSVGSCLDLFAYGLPRIRSPLDTRSILVAIRQQ